MSFEAWFLLLARRNGKRREREKKNEKNTGRIQGKNSPMLSAILTWSRDESVNSPGPSDAMA
jgi:hypothetical protein